MKGLQFYLLMSRILSFLLLLMLFSCKSDSDRIESAIETVNIFVSDLDLKNSNSIKKNYPKFDEIGKYWILNNFKINDSKINGDAITVYCSYLMRNQINKPLMFVLMEFDSEYKIVESKGLSAYYETEIYDCLINLGCINYNSNDVEIEKECSKREYIYNSTIEVLKSELESKVSIDNSNLSTNGGYYVSGNLIVTNYSDFTIPSAAYRMSIGFINTNTKTGTDKQVISSFSPNIPPKGTVSIPVTYVPINGGNKLGGIFEIDNVDALKKVFNETAILLNWDCSKFDNPNGF